MSACLPCSTKVFINRRCLYTTVRCFPKQQASVNSQKADPRRAHSECVLTCSANGVALRRYSGRSRFKMSAGILATNMVGLCARTGYAGGLLFSLTPRLFPPCFFPYFFCLFLRSSSVAALYFLWLGYYTTLLWFPAIFGILVMFYGVGNFRDRTVSVQHRFWLLCCIFLRINLKRCIAGSPINCLTPRNPTRTRSSCVTRTLLCALCARPVSFGNSKSHAQATRVHIYLTTKPPYFLPFSWPSGPPSFWIFGSASRPW